MRYRRANVPGATYFFTVNLADRKRALLVDNVDRLRSSMVKVKHTYPFHIDAIAMMPDHLHAIWQLPPGDADFSMRWNLIKARFSRQLHRDEVISSSRMKKG